MINSDKKKVTVDFHWTTEDKDGTSGYGFYVKHHHTEEYGPTISISETEDDYTSFPSKMFAEIVDFLRSEGVVEPNEEFIKKTNRGVREVTEKNESKTVLSIPEIENSAPQTEQSDPTEVVIDNSNPIASFDSDGTSQIAQEQPQDATGEPQMVKKASGPSDEEKAAEMVAEREAAIAKSGNNAKSIKRSHEIEEAD
jgi:hypothetical protein